jgi:hypothetical protein
LALLYILKAVKAVDGYNEFRYAIPLVSKLMKRLVGIMVVLAIKLETFNWLTHALERERRRERRGQKSCILTRILSTPRRFHELMMHHITINDDKVIHYQPWKFVSVAGF